MILTAQTFESKRTMRKYFDIFFILVDGYIRSVQT